MTIPGRRFDQPEVVRLALAHFNLRRGPGLNVTLSDGRRWVDALPPAGLPPHARYDVVVQVRGERLCVCVSSSRSNVLFSSFTVNPGRSVLVALPRRRPGPRREAGGGLSVYVSLCVSVCTPVCPGRATSSSGPDERALAVLSQ